MEKFSRQDAKAQRFFVISKIDFFFASFAALRANYKEAGSCSIEK
jgi:hypothetical protein